MSNITLIKSVPISLRAFGYSMASADGDRHTALQKAIDAHGVEKVLQRLNDIKVNTRYLEKTEKDILYVMAKMPLPEDEDEDEDDVPFEEMPFIECMTLLNQKLCKATLDKDYEMINLMVTTMTNVIKSTL
jgi:hypothetical protein